MTTVDSGPVPLTRVEPVPEPLPAPFPGPPTATSGGATPVGPTRRRPRGLGSIQTKLLLMLLLASIVSTAVVGFFGYRSGTEALEEATYARLQEVGNDRRNEVQDFIDREKSAVLLDSRGAAVEASKAFNAAFAELRTSRTTGPQRDALAAFYADTFVPELEKNRGQEYEAAAFVPSSAARTYLQAHYTRFSGDAETSIRRDDAGDGSAWTRANKTHNPYFRSVVTELGLDDVVMLDNEANVVYTTRKRAELGSNVARGEYRGGGLQQVYDAAVASNSSGFVAVGDFEHYLPSYGAPTMFIASPIGTADDLTGVLVYELSVEKLNTVLTGNEKPGVYEGLGRSGEAYLVGEDGTLRTDSRELFENPGSFASQAVATGTRPDVADRIVETRQSMLALKDRSAPAREGSLGRSGTMRGQDYLGHDVLAAYQPAKIEGLDWTMVTKISAEEALEPVSEFARNLLFATAVVILLICAASVLMARVFTVPLNRLLEGVRAVAGGRLGAQVDAERRHDEFGDLGVAFNDMSSSLRTKQELIEAQRAENDRILSGLMPPPVVQRYRGGETDISAEHDDVSVVYTEVEGFDQFTARHSAAESLTLLNALSRGFDDAARAAGIEKVRSVGTGYVASSGLVVQRVDHARRVVDFALGVADMVQRFNSQHGSRLVVRAGINSGAVRSGLVGRSDVVYNLWGDAVDLAYRVRTVAGEPGIYVTDEVKQRLTGGYEYTRSGTLTEDDGAVPVWRLRSGGSDS